jgi:hypothetical protein
VTASPDVGVRGVRVDRDLIAIELRFELRLKVDPGSTEARFNRDSTALNIVGINSTEPTLAPCP